MSNEPTTPPKIDFAPVMRECQKYAKLLKDVVDKGELTEDDYTDIDGYRVSIADSFCLLIFGEPFDEIRKKYFGLIASKYRETINQSNKQKKE